MKIGPTVLIGCCLVASSAGGLPADDKPLPQKALPRRFDPDRFLGRHDQNKDGWLDAAECPERIKGRFAQLDRNKDGKLTRAELEKAAPILESMFAPNPARAKGRPAGRPGEVITPAARGERLTDTLKVGDRAPDFTLPDPQGEQEVTLSSYRGKRPVVLIFGSYT